ncbi:hypothetical protein GCM10007160_31760 [Litchfieldella qijiaojingensis]|uniref:Lipoprotein n=1 Tax=Litchfieldella qijiaojingensis TaxID=980347 RepID=A0ABQ2Z123_9GAMM|nr:hypothetical protein [Halomonas qijiaojingensis]GGY01507.1 hypothetical protein GCM10007160_31760 [Halomonas qijiaojingensis]
MKGSMQLVTLVVLGAALLMAGCSYKPARFTPAEIRTEPLIEIDGGHGHRHRGYHDYHEYYYYDDRRRGFCPPGLRMQGRC